MLEKIISGGQTGADRAALDAALAIDFPAGGYCPAGRQSEDGKIDDKYPLTEIAGGYRQRTKKNVELADATAIFYRSQLSGGTRLTQDYCIKRNKPHILFDSSEVSETRAAETLIYFIEENGVTVLNVAGLRFSNCPGIYDYVRAVIADVLENYAYYVQRLQPGPSVSLA